MNSFTSCLSVMHHAKGTLGECYATLTIIEGVMASGVELGGNPAVSASDSILASPALFASHGSAVPQRVVDEDVVPDPNAEVSMYTCAFFPAS